MADIEVVHRYAAPPEEVFDAWLDPAKARRFLFATPTGQGIRCDIDPTVGGRFAIVDRRPAMGDVEHVGEYLEIDRPRRLVFTFGVPQFDPAMTRVEIAFVPDGSGSRLTLTHTGVAEAWKDETPKGWAMILGALEAVAAG